ncbi:MAG: LamG-like jellyroll fold domain-containing protein [Prolixibacteraceae bacterium]
MKTHLLINPEQLVSGQLDSLIQKKIPLAFLSTDKLKGKLADLKAKISANNLPVMIISDEDSLVKNRLNSGIFQLYGHDLDKIMISDTPEIMQKELTNRELLWLVADSGSIPSLDYFIRFWEHTGKLPNFIQVNSQNIWAATTIIDSLNRHPKIFGVIRNGDLLLSEVSWKDFPNRKTNGYFSFPINPSNSSALTPYKAGFQFSPDIILPSPENLGNMKIFNAVPLDPDFGLTDHFIFSKRVQNLKRKNDAEIINYSLDFKKDETLDNCAQFAGKAYVDGGLMSRSALKPNFSITAWIKPTELGNNNCILGKGKDFVLKIHDGMLTFTVQGIKDYFSLKTIIPVNQWSFIGLVHSVSDNQISFYLNGKLTEKISLLTPYSQSDFTMLIGSNLWEEYFVGYIYEIRIWDRELNEDQMQNEFLSVNHARHYLPTSWIVGIFLVLSLFAFIFYRKKNRRTLSENVVKIQPVNYADHKIKETSSFLHKQEQINCFGGLKVINAEGKDISLKFSPKLKQLFVLIFLHSVESEKGISSKKMSDLLWPGMSVPKTKNIRGTNIQNLKALLNSCSEIKLVFQDKLWKLEFADNYFVDLSYVEAKLHEPDLTTDVEKAKKDLTVLLPILKKGTLFPNMNESWIDPYVDRMSSKIIGFGLKMFQLLPEENFDSLLLDLAEVISINDPLNETALGKKISILIRHGKLSLAHSAFDNFCKLYFELYKEKYPSDFKSFIDHENDSEE